MTAMPDIPYQTDDLRIAEIRTVATPALICEELPITETAARVTHDTRLAIRDILQHQDDRLLAVVGPCSIHDTAAALEYAGRLREVRERLDGALLIVMRVYFEKPRTTVGWKGLINDPDLDRKFNINKGLRMARQLLLDLNRLGMPAGTEYLDIITPQYIADLVAWGAIGARTTESQVHRELASGLSCPVGFKNGTDGNIKIAADAISAASRPHHFLSLTKSGHSAIYGTTGNHDCHVILRGGAEPNYDAQAVRHTAEVLEQNALPARMMIDFSHANSARQHRRQVEVGRAVAAQIAGGERCIIGVMIESHLKEGKQAAPAADDGAARLVYGQSITDACLGFDDTAPLLTELAEAVEKRRGARLTAAG